MNKTAIMLATVAAAALAACQSPPAPPPFTPRAAVPYDCTANTCDLTLSITAGALDIDRDPLTIENHNVKINWFAPADYEFHKSDAILLKDPNADPRQQFKDKVICDARGNPLPHDLKGICFQWHDKNTERDDFPYEVRVYKAGTNGPPLVLDPTIKNQG